MKPFKIRRKGTEKEYIVLSKGDPFVESDSFYLIADCKTDGLASISEATMLSDYKFKELI